MNGRPAEHADDRGGMRRFLVLLVVVFGFLALVVVGLLAALKWTEPKNTLMGTTAGGTAPTVGGSAASTTPTEAPK